jgi:chorismate mutase
VSDHTRRDSSEREIAEPPIDKNAAIEALASCRRELEDLDREIIGLLAKRVARSKEIGALKRVAGLPTLDPAREADVIRRAATVAREHGLSDEKVRDIFWHVIGLSRSAQTEGE